MAHFCLMVIGKDIEEIKNKIIPLLNKYNENNLIEKKFKKEMSFDDMLKLYNNYDKKSYNDLNNFAYNVYRYIYDEESHSFGIFINPNAKFSNIKLGGRYLFNLNIKNKKEGSFIANKNEIDIERMKLEATDKAVEFKKYFIERLNFDENKFIETFGSDEENVMKYISEYCQPEFFYKEKWNEKGKMTTKEWYETFEKFFNELENETVIALFDCHK